MGSTASMFQCANAPANAARSGFVAIVGPTNAGKSTLLNAIMGRKAAITSHKVQTTRARLRTVKMTHGAQLIFVDTPGFFAPRRRLDKSMIHAAAQSIADADAVALLIDATHGITQTVSDLIARVKDTARPEQKIYAAINKVDAVEKGALLPLARALAGTGIFQEIFMVSAIKNQGIDPMLKTLASAVPDGPLLFDAKDRIDVPDALWLAEITREKIYKFLHQELPYKIHVSTDRMEADDEGVLEIAQTIYVAAGSHKKIVIGRGGGQLKKIGTEARREIQNEWGVNARLRLFVRVEDWESNAEHYEEQGLSYVK